MGIDWLCSGLNWLAKESVIGIRLSSHYMEEVDTKKVKNDAIVAMYTWNVMDFFVNAVV